MNNSKNLSLHYLALAGVIALGTALRFWNLDLKALWLDEILTALLSLGHSYKDVPLEVVMPLSMVQNLFTLHSDVSCPQIAHTVATQSTHPPLFFCLMHQWLSWVEPWQQPLSWKLRALPALFGVGAIAAVYCLNRIAFSPAAGLMGAAFMAVSPFGVYISQEARHYTLPVLFITLALVGLMQIHEDLYSRQTLPQPVVWVSWGIVNSIGCYVHYFFILAFIAQLLTLIGLMYWRRRILPRGSWVALSLVIAGVAVSYLPWLPVVLENFGRPETGWIPKPEHIAPVYQTLLSWILMVIALPVEEQPVWIIVPVVLLIIGLSSWIGWQVWKGLKLLWRQPSTQLATLTLSCFILCVLLEFFAIIYVLGKDISIAPRYNFVYYPAVIALLGASFASRELKVSKLQVKSSDSLTFGNSFAANAPSWSTSRFARANATKPSTLVLFLSLLSCVFVVSNLVFLKPYHPEKVAQEINLEPAVPLMVVMGYHNFQDVALELSFALAIENQKSGISKRTTPASLAFLKAQPSYDAVWKKLTKLPTLPESRLNLWLIAPGLRRRDFPAQLAIAQGTAPGAIANQTTCTLDPTQYHRRGVPYQLYRCS
jgi:uncharacterized membrane protein